LPARGTTILRNRNNKFSPLTHMGLRRGIDGNILCPILAGDRPSPAALVPPTRHGASGQGRTNDDK